MRDVFDGAIVAFECLGDVHVAEHRFLDAITDQGRVQLSPGVDPPFTGARWECMGLNEPGVFALVSAGAVHGLRYLDGRTTDGSVHTVGDGLPPFSGTRWQILELSPGVVTIRCLGDFHNPKHQFLDGRTQVGDVQLVGNTSQFSGTKWGTIPLPRPSLEVETQREQTGSTLTLIGTNFSHNDNVRFSAEGIVGHGSAEHAPFPLGAKNANGDGFFQTSIFVDYVPTQPFDVPVIVRATDHNGRTAHVTSNGFHP